MKFKRKISLTLIIISMFYQASHSWAAEIMYNIYSYNDNSIFVTKFNLKDFVMKIVKSNNKTEGKSYLNNFSQNNLVAINGSFFYKDGRPVGILKIYDQLFSLGRNEQAALGWKEDGSKISIDIIKPDLKLFIDNREIRVNRFNNFTRASEVVLFSNEYGENTLTDGKRVEIIINQNKEIVEINKDGGSKIEPEYMILSLPENFDLSSYKVGSKVKLKVTYKASFKPNIEWDKFDYILTGIPLLIKDNKINDSRLKKLKLSFSSKPHARTAVCITNDNNILFAVTNYEKKKGLTLFELAEFLKRRDCKDSLNLDGGSSSVMLYRNKILNKSKFLDKEISNGITVNNR